MQTVSVSLSLGPEQIYPTNWSTQNPRHTSSIRAGPWCTPPLAGPSSWSVESETSAIELSVLALIIAQSCNCSVSGVLDQTIWPTHPYRGRDVLHQQSEVHANTPTRIRRVESQVLFLTCYKISEISTNFRNIY